MRRTGSTCARNWLTRSGPQGWLPGIVVGLVLTVGLPVRAGWTNATVDGGVPDNVRVWGPGLYSVSTPTGALLAGTDGGTRFIPATTSVATHLTPTGCFVSFGRNNFVEGAQGCADAGILFPTVQVVSDVRVSEGGTGYALGLDDNQQDSRVVFAPSTDGGIHRRPWLPAAPNIVEGTPTQAMGVLDLGSSTHALLAVNRYSAANLLWYRDGGRLATYPLTVANPPTLDVDAIDLLPSGGSTPLALVGWTTGLYRGVLGSSPTPLTQVSLPGGPGAVTGVDVNPDGGSAYGTGFGMAVVQRDGGSALLSAVPALQPGELGAEWRVNPTLPTVGLTAREVACHGARFCVIALNRVTPPNLLLYTNALPPTIIVEPDLFVGEGTSRTLPIRAQDPDGDAVRLTVEPGSLNTPALSMNVVGVDGGGVDLQLTAGEVCQDTFQDLRIIASDGLAEHDQRRDLVLQVVHTRPPQAPQLNRTHTVVQAGQPAPPISVVPVVERCGISGYDWMAATPNSPRLETQGVTATFPSPTVLCAREGQTHVYRVRAFDDAGVASAPTDFTVQVRPWGIPSAPFAADAGVALNAGQAVQLVPQSLHACEGTSGFPGVDTTWTLVGGGLDDAGVRLRAEDGGILTELPAVTSRLAVETQECADARLAFSVRHLMRDGSGLASPDSQVGVTVDPQWLPASGGEVLLGTPTTTALSVSGDAGVTGLNCLAQRGGVRARLDLTREDGTPVDSRVVTAPGPWRFNLQDNCYGGTYRVSGTVVGNVNERTLGRSGAGGEVSALAAPVSVVVPPVEVELAPLEAPQLTATCGDAARGVLQQRIPAGPCAAVEPTWQQTGGPALSQPVLRGQQVEVSTQETDFGALIGQSVELLVTADTGRVSQRTHVVPITAAPFVEVSRQTERPSSAETSLVGVAVELRNITACGVREVQHVEHIEGMDYVPGSARFNGAPVEAELEGEVLTVSGLVLEGNATGTLSYVVRPRLFGQARFEGRSSLRGVPISTVSEEEVPPPVGCGCAGGGSGAALAGLAGLVAVLRRRRGG